jgi:N-methylhydantoinase B/oxoprolinase/acetone carboxylase alpha subunit
MLFGPELPTKTVHCNTRIVNHKVNAFWMSFAEVIHESSDAAGVGNVESMKFDLDQSTIGLQRSSLFELYVCFQILQSGFASTSVSSCEIYS